jgi:tetratricopeptide (TPR) repeat protein
LNWLYRVILIVVLNFFFATALCTQVARQGNLSSTPKPYDKAFQLLQAGKPNDALAELDEALAINPDDPALNNLRGLVAAQLGHSLEAEAGFRRVIRLLPHAAMGYNNLAALLWQLGRSAEASTAFRQAIKEEPQNFTALVGLGTILSETREYGQAVPYLERGWASRPGDFQVGYELARSLTELKRPSEAEKILERLTPPQDAATAAKFYALSAGVAEQIGKQTAAIADYRRAYELSPQSFEIYLALVRSILAKRDTSWIQLPGAPAGLSAEQHFALGLMFASGGAYPRAVSHFQETLQLEPTSRSATYNLALAYRGAGNLKAAIDLLENAVEKQPNAELYDLLASLEEEAGLYVQAVRHYQRAVELDSTKEQYYFDLGSEYLLHLTFDAAVEAFRLGSAKFPASARLYVGRGLAQFALRQYADAADAFLSALEADPSSPDAFLAWNGLPPFVVAAQWGKIQPRLQRLADLYPENSQVAFCYGAALLHQAMTSNRAEFLDRSLSFLETAVGLNPRLAPAHLELGNLYVQRKQNNNAVASFREAIRLDPNSEMAHYKLAQIYRDLNQLALAEQELRLYQKLAQNHRDQVARTRSTIRQFVLAKPSAETGAMESKP